jgi:uncharacterized Rmd1/YagE family protein
MSDSSGAVAPVVVVPVRAFAVSATVQPRDVATMFSTDAERVRLTKTFALVRYGTLSWAVAHDFGAVVFFGVDAAECERVLKVMLSRLGEQPHGPLEESFIVEVSAGAPPAVHFDRVVVPELEPRTVGLVSLVVAQSVAMEYYEGDLDALIESLIERSRQLQNEGGLPGRARELMRLIGRGMTMRSEVVHTLSLLDSPGVTWENEAYDKLYRELRGVFEIEERYRALDHESHIVQDNLALLVDIVRQRRYTILEVTVAVFVVAETLLFVAQLLLQRH